MPIELKEFKEKVESLGPEFFEFYTTAVQAEQQRGISEKSAANREAQGMRQYKLALEKLGFNKESDELEAFIETLRSSTSKAKEADTQKLTLDQLSAELLKLQDSFGKTQTELATERKKSEELKLSSTRKTLKSKLSEALRDKVYGHDFVADSLINDGKVTLGDDDIVSFIEGDTKISYEDGIKKLLESRTDILKNSQRPGAGTAPNQQSKGTQKYTFEQLASMSKEDVKANLTDIKASLGIDSQ